MDIVTYKLSQKYADKVAAGFSSVRVDGLNIIFTLNDGKTATVAVPAPKDGVSITNVSLNQQNHLICTLSDGTAIDAGLVPQGVDGRDAKINGVNTLTIEAGDNITLDQEGNILTIHSTGGGSGGTSNYNALTNKPKINNVELRGNKSLNDLGIQPEITSQNKLASDLIDDTNSGNKFVTENEKTTWNTEIENLHEEDELLKRNLQTTTGLGEEVTLEKTTELDFVKPPLPRGNAKQDTTTGKNLLENTATSQTINGVTFTVNNNKSITCNGTATANTIFRTVQTPDFPDNEDMLFTGCPVGGSSSTYQLQYSNNRDKAFQDMGNGIVIQKMDYNTYPNTYVQIRIVEGYTCNNLTFYPMIRLATIEDDTYEPYTGGIPSPNPDYSQEIEVVTGNVEVTISNENNTESKTLSVSLGNIELCKIGNYQDYLYKNNGKWYKYNAINKLVLNGSENWAVHGSIASWFYWDGLTNGFTDSTISGYALFNYFTQKAYSTVTSLKNGEFAYGQVAGETKKRFVIKDTDYTTVADFKSWLSTHNTIVYYVRATPTDTEITDATLISQLEEISKTLSYQGQTNITSNTIALFDVEAYQSTKLILEEMATAIVALGGV